MLGASPLRRARGIPRCGWVKFVRPYHVRVFFSAILRALSVNRRVADRVLVANFRDDDLSLVLLQVPNDLLFREPFLTHLVRPAMGRTLIEE